MPDTEPGGSMIEPGLGDKFFEPGELDYMQRVGPPAEAETPAAPSDAVDDAPAAPTPAADVQPVAQDAAPNWDAEENPYRVTSAEALRAYQWAEQQLLQREAADAFNGLVQQGIPAAQAEQLVRAALNMVAVEREQAALMQREAALQQLAKPIYINQVVQRYARQGVQLDTETLMGFNTPQEIEAYVKGVEKFVRAQNYQQRVAQNVDRVGDPAPASAPARELSGLEAIAAGLAEADRKARR